MSCGEEEEEEKRIRGEEIEVNRERVGTDQLGIYNMHTMQSSQYIYVGESTRK